MSNTIPFLLQRNLDVFAESDPARWRAMIEECYTEDCAFHEPNGGVYRGREAIHKVRGRSGRRIPISNISRLPNPMHRVMAGESGGYRAAPAAFRFMLGPISSSPGRVASRPFVSSSTDCLERIAVTGAEAAGVPGHPARTSRLALDRIPNRPQPLDRLAVQATCPTSSGNQPYDS